MDEKMMWCPRCGGMVRAQSVRGPIGPILSVLLVGSAVEIGVIAALVPAGMVRNMAIIVAVFGTALACGVLYRTVSRARYICAIHEIRLTVEHPPVSGTDFGGPGENQ